MSTTAVASCPNDDTHSRHPISRKELTVTELDRLGLLHAADGTHISKSALFIPADELGAVRPIAIQRGAYIGPFAVIHGGVTVCADGRIEEHAVVGKPELGYAVGNTYPGSGNGTVIGEGTVIRSGATVYAGVSIGAATVIGHQTLLRTGVQIGSETLLGHFLCIERETQIGNAVRCSPGSHITSSTVLADRVFLGAGVRTINDKTLTWRDPGREPELIPPRFGYGAKVGTGSVILGGVTIGERALVGAGSLVTRSIPAGSLAYGHPAQVRGQAR